MPRSTTRTAAVRESHDEYASFERLASVDLRLMDARDEAANWGTVFENPLRSDFSYRPRGRATKNVA